MTVSGRGDLHDRTPEANSEAASKGPPPMVSLFLRAGELVEVPEERLRSYLAALAVALY